MAHDVLDEIQANNEWRDGEFAKYRVNSNHVDQILWCRMCIPMIYAHWEGFVVDSFKVLLKHLNNLNLAPAQTPTNLVVLSLGDSYRSLSGKQSFTQRIDFTKRFHDSLKVDIKFQTKIDTKSNLKTSVLYELCEMFGLDHSKFTDLESDINRLVSIRNSIAHGENNIQPNSKNIDKFIISIRTAMDILLEEIDSFLNKKMYCISHQPQT